MLALVPEIGGGFNRAVVSVSHVVSIAGSDRDSAQGCPRTSERKVGDDAASGTGTGSDEDEGR